MMPTTPGERSALFDLRTPDGVEIPDLSNLDSLQARQRVCWLIHTGLPETTVADMVGWSVTDVRRALVRP